MQPFGSGHVKIVGQPHANQPIESRLGLQNSGAFTFRRHRPAWTPDASIGSDNIKTASCAFGIFDKMTVSSTPEVAFGVLPRADGSARYSHAGYTVLASVNGPIEAQRRDEHAYEAHVDVIVRPAAGVGGEMVREQPPSWDHRLPS